jgi:hypothetical protein
MKQNLGFALVYLGEHYVIDLLAGATLAEGVRRAAPALGIDGSSRMPRRWSSRSPRTSRRSTSSGRRTTRHAFREC